MVRHKLAKIGSRCYCSSSDIISLLRDQERPRE